VSVEYIELLRRRNPLPINEVLDLLSFKKNEMGGASRAWDNLQVTVVQWFDEYHFICTWVASDRRSAGMPEFRVGSKIVPADLLAVMYERCRGAFEEGSLPIELQIGKNEIEFRKKTQSLESFAASRQKNDRSAHEEAPAAADCSLCPTRAAVLEFAATRFQTLARKVVFRLQRNAATGIYGDDYQHKTMWDEYCHEIQNGPYDLLESPWNTTIDSICDSVVKAVPSSEAALLTIRAMWDLDREDEGHSTTVLVAPDLIRCNLRQAVIELAAARNIWRFDPY
jgi:hypothetical protein